MRNKPKSKPHLTKKEYGKRMERSQTWDWEKDLCENFDRLIALHDREDQLRLIESIIDDIEDLVYTAYYKGLNNKIIKN